jgi:VWFA-related protein
MLLSSLMMKHAMKWPTLLLLAALAGSAQAQEGTPETFGEEVDVEVVNVDVVVTDRSGKRVTDLEPYDFELRVDGRPVAIEYFSGPPLPAAGSGRPALEAQAAEPLDLAPRDLPESSPISTLVFFVDQSALAQKVRHDTLAELRAYLAAAPAPARRVMVAAFQDELHLLAAPTSDPQAVEAAFAALEKLPARATAIETERRQLELDVRNFGRAAPMARSQIDEATNAAREEQRSQSERLRIQNEIELWGEQEIDRQSRSVRALTRIVGALEAVEGRKAVVLATAGYTSEPALYLLRFFAQKLGGAKASEVTRVPRLDELGIRLAQDFERLVAAAEDARVAFYTVSPREPPAGQNSAEFVSAGAGAESAAMPPRDTTSVDTGASVVRLAAATGGRSFYVDSSLDTALGELDADSAAVYSLGFSTGEAAGAKDHGIEVVVLREGLSVRHRETFRRRPPGELAEAALVAAATLGTARNPFGLALESGPPVPGAKKGEPSRVPIAVRIPLAAIALLPRGPDREGLLQIQIAIQNAAGRVTLDAGMPVPIRVVAGDFERAVTEVWVHRAELELEPGTHRVAVLVSDSQGGEFSTVVQSFEVAGP